MMCDFKINIEEYPRAKQTVLEIKNDTFIKNYQGLLHARHRIIVRSAISACSYPGSAENSRGQKGSARQVLIDNKAFSGSSVNVVAGTRQMLYTHGRYQYAGYYDPEGKVVLAKRKLGENDWFIQKTAFSANTTDAHNSISLIVDGKGYLHLAWGHHDSALNYSVSKFPGSISMREPASMVGSEEGGVTYPQFFSLASGDLLFVYRDGASGQGKVVLNHYDSEREKWTRRQDNLIDGEGRRSAYWDMAVANDDTLHLAWVWRESPDVATNHDLLYAQSTDGGQTWQRRDGTDYELPIRLQNAEVAYNIDQNSNLMNPPVIAVADNGVPFIASYWSENPEDMPGFNIVHHTDDGWRFISGPEAKQQFSLAGGGTKNPPISRAALLIEEDADKLHLIYRSDYHGGRVIGSSLGSLTATQWTYQYLTESSVGAWEPSIDPAQWEKYGQAHLLLQDVAQVDGDDRFGKQQQPTAIGLLIWLPD